MLPLLFGLLIAASPPSLEDAAESYRQGLIHRDDAATARSYFRAAASQYELLWESGHRSPALAAQRGQAHFLADQFPQALHAYHEGLRDAPDDARLHAGLAAIRAQFANVPIVPRFHWWVNPWWFIALTYLAMWHRWWRGHRRGALLVGILMLIGIATIALVERMRQVPRIAIVAQATWCRQGNAASYPAIGDSPLSVGTELRIRGERGGWAHIEFNDGERGWIAETHLFIERPREVPRDSLQ